MNTKKHITEPQATPRLAYSVEAAAEALSIGRTLVFALIRDGKIRAVKCNGRTVLPVAEIEAFLRRGGSAA